MHATTITKKLWIVFIVLGWGVTLKAQSMRYIPDPDPVITERLEEWKDLKFGLLMHWGPYSQWGVVESWSICPEDLSWATGAQKSIHGTTYQTYVDAYEKLSGTFNPLQFNPEAWARAAKAGGMRYVVFTTKHHDGFCMFDTRYSDYKITSPACPFSTHPKKNIAKELFDAFRQEGLWTGAYFSKPDWHSDYYWWKKFPPADRNCNYSISKYPGRWQQFVDYTQHQILELMSDYGPMDILWLDGGWVRIKTNKEIEKALLEEYEGSRFARNPQSQDIRMDSLVKQVREKQPRILVVDRDVEGPYQNYLTPEQHIPETGLPYPWETCMTMASSWSFVPGDRYKPAGELIKKIVDVVSKGGNFLLNIGPGPDGTLGDTAMQRLEVLGRWLQRNGEAIYSTRMFDVYGEGDDIRYTRSKSGETVYVFVEGNQPSQIALKKIQCGHRARIHFLGDEQDLSWESVPGEGIVLNIPDQGRAEDYGMRVLKIEGY